MHPSLEGEADPTDDAAQPAKRKKRSSLFSVDFDWLRDVGVFVVVECWGYGASVNACMLGYVGGVPLVIDQDKQRGSLDPPP